MNRRRLPAARTKDRARRVSSNKQRREELAARSKSRAEKQRAAKRKVEIEQMSRRGAIVDTSKLARNRSYGAPEFMSRGYYEDLPFTCQRCGKEEVWAATQQKWWYEVAKGDVWTTAKFCRPCRRYERERRNAARRTHLEGIARKQA